MNPKLADHADETPPPAPNVLFAYCKKPRVPRIVEDGMVVSEEPPPLEVPDAEPELVPKLEPPTTILEVVVDSDSASPCSGCYRHGPGSPCSSASASPPQSPLVYRGALSRTSLGNCSSPSLLSALAGGTAGGAAPPPQAPAAKLPRTLSTSVLRIKNRSSFWDKFWNDKTKRDL